MAVDVNIPETGESVTEVSISKWLKNDGDRVKVDESICVLESDKADFELPAPAQGILKILKKVGDVIQVGEAIAQIDEGGEPPGIMAMEGSSVPEKFSGTARRTEPNKVSDLSPSVRRMVKEHDLDPGGIEGTGRGGRLTKEDVLKHLEQIKEKGKDVGSGLDKSGQLELGVQASPYEAIDQISSTMPGQQIIEKDFAFDGKSTVRVPISKIRRRIAERLVNARQITAMLTTFNEIDMSAVLEMRNKYKEEFDKVHGVSIGIMSFFARACVVALQQFPSLNAKLDGDEIVYHRYVHLGIAVSTERGLVVPVLKNVESMSFARIEIEIKRMSASARTGKLSIAELSDGTFSITNGGIFGSLLSTPILNMPQTGILGMHVIKKRPVVVNDRIEIRPMMYVALTYDHRIVDGRESVSFLVKLKDMLEEPARLLLLI